MVLKKSNSSLNSGATQHVSRGGFINPISREWPGTRGSIEIAIELDSVEMTEEVEACLDQVNEYLGFSGPLFDHSYRRTTFGRPHVQWKRESEASIDKGGNWRLKQRISSLMGDIDFLREVSTTIDISFTEIISNIAFNRSRGSTKTTTSSQILQAFESEEQENLKVQATKEDIKSRRQQTYHGRGVQRRRDMATANRAHVGNVDPQEEENTTKRKSVLTFTFYEPCLVDARTSKICARGYSKERKGQKSFNKCKGYKNGVRSHGRQRYFKVKEDMEDTQFCTNKSTRRDEVVVAENSCGEDETCSYDINFADFISRGKATKHISSKKAKETVNWKEIDSSDRPHYPKGSYVYINWDPDVNHSLTDSSWEVINTSDSSASSPVELIDIKPVDISSNSADEELDLKDEHEASFEVLRNPDSVQRDHTEAREKDFELFTESFIQIQTLMPGDGISLFPETLEKLHLEGRPNVSIGESVPHCFCVSSPNYINKSYVVARRVSWDGRIWSLSLQGFSEFLSKSFKNRLSQLYQSEEYVSLTQVISVAEETLNQNVLSQKLIPRDNKYDISSEDEQFRNHIWGELASIFTQQVSFHTAEVAAEKMELFSNKVQASETTNNLVDCASADIDCGICFTPCNFYNPAESAMMLTSCGHAYCITCWQTYIYHSIRNGAPTIACMSSGCDVLLDETTLKSLVPANLVTSWQARLRDRLLQTSEFTSWCPNPRCGHVAVSSKFPLKKQFGSPLVCSCLQHRCSNCNEAPHWPVSCDQMANYKKLLSKTGNNSEVPMAHTSYWVDMKKCPKCKYPIEKFQGCPSMVCRMCWFNFCWNCLQSTEKHNVYSCKASPNSHFITFHLNNSLVYDLPIKYFLESVKANKQCALLRKKYLWLEKLQKDVKLQYSSHHRLPKSPLWNFSCAVDVNSSLQLFDETLTFLLRASTQSELFYVLLGFVQLNKTKACTRLIAAVKSKLSRLHFITDRLNRYVVGKSLPHITVNHRHARVLIKTGEATLEEMFVMVPQLQQSSKDVKTAWVGDIDPSKHLRYK